METSDYVEILIDILDLRNRINITHYPDIYTKGGGDANGCILNKILYKMSDVLPLYISKEAENLFKTLGISNYKELVKHEILNRSMKNIKKHHSTYMLFRNSEAKLFQLDHNAPMAYLCKKLTQLDYTKGKIYLREKVLDLLITESGIDCITMNENKLRNQGKDANNKSRKERINKSNSIMIKIS